MATDMIDCINGSAGKLPAELCARIEKVAGYDTGTDGTNGTDDVLWRAATWARFPHAGKLHINQNGHPGLGQMLDYEARAATRAELVTWGRWRIANHAHANYYCDLSNLNEAARTVFAGGIDPGQTRWWLAAWDLSRGEAEAKLGSGKWKADGADIRVPAIQWASPTSNPNTLLPGTSLTLKQANCDLSVTLDDWFAPARTTTRQAQALAALGMATAGLETLRAYVEAGQ